MLDSAQRNGDRPIRIFYLSDFDPGGDSMPLAMARKVEWLIEKHGLADLKVIQVLLTHEQCIEYQLPRIPLKEGEKRATEWEEKYGAGATELDALEALHPGKIKELVDEALDRYFDHDLQERWREECANVETAVATMTDEVREEFADALRPHQQEYEEIACQAAAARETLLMVFAKLVEEMERRVKDEELLAPLNNFKSEHEPDEDDDALSDSERTYDEQQARSKFPRPWALRRNQNFSIALPSFSSATSSSRIVR
jgi:hypothetical protein